MPGRRGRSAAKRARPTWRGVGVVVVGLAAMAGAALYGRVDLLFVGLVLVLLPLASAMMLTLDRPWITVTRSFGSDVVAAGEHTTVTLLLRNEASRATPAMRWRDAVRSGLDAPQHGALGRLGEHALASRDRSDSASVRYLVGTKRRGIYDVGPVLLERVDPFGLVRCEYAVGASKPLLVVPRVVELDHGELDVSKSEGNEHELVRHSIPSADELIARDYRPGDPLRRVHWRATARHDKLMVRQEEQRSNPEAWVLFDTERGRGDRAPVRSHERNPRFEAAVDLLASLGGHLLTLGYAVGVVETTPIQLVGRAGAGRGGLAGLTAAAFDAPNGEQMLLAGLAGVRQSERAAVDAHTVFSSALHRNALAVPAFVIAVDGSHEQLSAIAALRPLCDPAVVFLVGDAAHGLREAYEHAGWVCVPMTPGDGPERPWLIANERESVVRADG